MNIIDLIKEQLELVKTHWPEMLMKPREQATNEIILAMIGELAELMDGYKALPWKPEPKQDNREYTLEEIVDLHHFVNELYLIWDVRTEEEVKKLYLKKKNKNLNDRGRIHQAPSNNWPRDPYIDD